MMNEKKVLGVLGGLGPMSSAYFYKLVTEKTLAQQDQEHLNMVLSSRADTPDRTAFILGESTEDPLPVMLREARKLVEFGAGVIALTCNTAHFFYERLQENLPVPVLNIGALAVERMEQMGLQSAGLLATSGTVNCGIYQFACKARGIQCLTPDQKGQQAVMQVIYNNIKQGLPPNMERFLAVAQTLKAQGAQGLILGCTELSLIKTTQQLPGYFLDPLEILAEQSILACGYAVRCTNQAPLHIME